MSYKAESLGEVAQHEWKEGKKGKKGTLVLKQLVVWCFMVYGRYYAKKSKNGCSWNLASYNGPGD